MADDPQAFAIEAAPRDGGATTVSVTGEVDLANADELAHAIRAALPEGDVVLDLRAVVFMDSAGVRALNTGLREAGEAGRALRLAAGLQPSVAQILELTGMTSLIEVVEP